MKMKFKNIRLSLFALFIAFCIMLNFFFRLFAYHFQLPLWLDCFGTALCAYTAGPVCGGIVGMTGNLLYGMKNHVSYIYGLTGATVGVIVGFAEERHRYAHRHGKVRSTHYVTVYYPIVRFQVDGVEYKLKSTGIVPRDKFPVGQSVDLLYDPNNPSHFHLDRGDMEERSTRGTIIFALVWLTIAVATIAVLLSVNPELRIQLERMLYNAIARLRSVINPSEN